MNHFYSYTFMRIEWAWPDDFTQVPHVVAGRWWLGLELPEGWLIHMTGNWTRRIQQLGAGTDGNNHISVFMWTLQHSSFWLEGESQERTVLLSALGSEHQLCCGLIVKLVTKACPDTRAEDRDFTSWQRNDKPFYGIWKQKHHCSHFGERKSDQNISLWRKI